MGKRKARAPNGQRAYTLTLDEIAALVTSSILTGASAAGRLALADRASDAWAATPFHGHMAEVMRRMADAGKVSPRLPALLKSFLTDNPDPDGARAYVAALLSRGAK